MSNLANLKRLLEDDRVPAIAARIALHAGETTHYRVNEEGDLVVSVLTLNHEVPIWANLDTLAGSSGHGVWFIPDLDTEVIITFDNGDYEGEAYIAMRTSGGRAPAGLASGKVFVLRLDVQVRSPDGTASAVPTMADFEALRGQYNIHTHPVAGAAASATTMQAPDPAGTTIFKAE
jgi:hypothetical protein